jgi:hypothetical protein
MEFPLILVGIPKCTASETMDDEVENLLAVSSLLAVCN